MSFIYIFFHYTYLAYKDAVYYFYKKVFTKDKAQYRDMRDTLLSVSSIISIV